MKNNNTEIVKRFCDNYDRIAVIDYSVRPAYKNGKILPCYRLTIFCDYDMNYIFFVSVFETLKEAMEKLKSINQNFIEF